MINRNTDEHIDLINKLDECDFNSKAINFMLLPQIIDSKTNEEAFELLEQVILSGYNDDLIELITDSNLIESRTNEELLKLINAYKKLNYNRLAFKIATNEAVIINRNVDEQILLMEKICDCFKPDISIFIDWYMLSCYSVDYQLSRINDICGCNESDMSFRNLLSVVESEEELDKLIESLFQCEDTKDMKINDDYFIKKLKQSDLPF